MAPFEGYIARGPEEEKLGKEIIGEEVEEENERALDEAGEISGHHSENLYDVNEDAAGEKVNLADGRPFQNDNTVEAPDLEVHAVEPGTRDALPDLEEEDDAAAKWLRENGG